MQKPSARVTATCRVRAAGSGTVTDGGDISEFGPEGEVDMEGSPSSVTSYGLAVPATSRGRSGRGGADSGEVEAFAPARTVATARCAADVGHACVGRSGGGTDGVR